MLKEFAEAFGIAGIVTVLGLALVPWHGGDALPGGRRAAEGAALAAAVAAWGAGRRLRGSRGFAAPAPAVHPAAPGGLRLLAGGKQPVAVNGGVAHVHRIVVENLGTAPVADLSLLLEAVEPRPGHGLPVRLRRAGGAADGALAPGGRAEWEAVREEFVPGRQARNAPHYFPTAEPLGLHFESPPARYAFTVAAVSRESPRPVRARCVVSWNPLAGDWRSTLEPLNA